MVLNSLAEPPFPELELLIEDLTKKLNEYKQNPLASRAYIERSTQLINTLILINQRFPRLLHARDWQRVEDRINTLRDTFGMWGHNIFIRNHPNNGGHYEMIVKSFSDDQYKDYYVATHFGQGSNSEPK